LPIAISLDGGANVHSTIRVLLEGLYFAGSRLLRFHIFYFYFSIEKGLGQWICTVVVISKTIDEN
jgi:hypothetical protein